jgi:hypothetical protein
MSAVAAVLASPAAALAGAPNYDCAIGGDSRLSIDQWADIVAATGVQPGSTVWGSASNVRQDGGSLDLVAALRGASWSIEVRESRFVTIKRPPGMLRGVCAFVPGNFVLRSADTGGFALRANPSPHARRLLVVQRGTAVWQIPNRAIKGRWFPIRAFVAHDGTIRAFDGWLRQRKPLVVNADRG